MSGALRAGVEAAILQGLEDGLYAEQIAELVFAALEKGAPKALWLCTRPGCGRDEIDARDNGCARGPCPMEFVG